MHIVFLGNCQVGALAEILRRYIAPYEAVTAEFVDAYEGINASSFERLSRAEMVVAQVSAQPPRLERHHIPANVTVHKVPVVSGAFLWPNQGVRHPNAPMSLHGNVPYMPEYGDRYLVECIRAGLSPEIALARYKVLDLATASHAQRLYELTLENQKLLDEESGYECASIIETHLASEHLFQSAFHFNQRIAKHIACTLFRRMGFDQKYGHRINDHLTEAPFVRRFVPIHPSIARHFGLSWVTPETRYPFLDEGAFTFDEYVLRFMDARWSAALQDGIAAARAGTPGARAKLEEGLAEAPNSAAGHHELSRIMEQEGDLAASVALQARAVALESSVATLVRYADLLNISGDVETAIDAARRATELDPVHLGAWKRLRNLRAKAGRLKAALAAAEKAVELAIDIDLEQAARTQLIRRFETRQAKRASA